MLPALSKPATHTPLVCLVAALAVAGFDNPSPVRAADAARLGVYRWEIVNHPGNIDAFSRWLGREVDLALAFEATDRWDNLEGPGWQLPPWAAWVQARAHRNLVLSVPMLPGPWDRSGVGDGPVSLKSCAAGAYNRHWAALADHLAAAGLNRAYLRLGWEMNGGWYAWRAQDQEREFAGCFRQMVSALRSAQPSAAFTFVWNPTAAPGLSNNWRALWPGDRYVDVVGVDVYDQSWAADSYPYPPRCEAACRRARQENAWNWILPVINELRDVAVAHGKPMAIPEWGVTTRSDGHGGGDNPFFVQRMQALINDPSYRVAWHVYFDVNAPDGAHQISPGERATDITQFPRAAALFQQLFGRHHR